MQSLKCEARGAKSAERSAKKRFAWRCSAT